MHIIYKYVCRQFFCTFLKANKEYHITVHGPSIDCPAPLNRHEADKSPGKSQRKCSARGTGGFGPGSLPNQANTGPK